MTKEAEKVAEDINNNIEPEFRICGECLGEGEVVDQGRINSKSIDIPYTFCPECNGLGTLG